MAFTVEYSIDGGRFIKVHEGILLEDTARHHAKRALTVNNADFARVVNEVSGGEIWSVRLNDDGSFQEAGS